MLAGLVAGRASCDGSSGRQWQAKGFGGQLRCQLQRLPEYPRYCDSGTRKSCGRRRGRERGAVKVYRRRCRPGSSKVWLERQGWTASASNCDFAEVAAREGDERSLIDSRRGRVGFVIDVLARGAPI